MFTKKEKNKVSAVVPQFVIAAVFCNNSYPNM